MFRLDSGLVRRTRFGSYRFITLFSFSFHLMLSRFRSCIPLFPSLSRSHSRIAFALTLILTCIDPSTAHVCFLRLYYYR
ncbi:hypothetical protein FA13DRAFT_1112337 [Coprinellus micaceus]|uniref:Uncharacterized protein n=1 Tax=Coprinellus micaceus TaxID=71717 RepID=A0A4Y7SWA7_COPMI|nr:hypothetical protein FA13DRAFT_1112337 [Coprinellus micaceus]